MWKATDRVHFMAQVWLLFVLLFSFFIATAHFLFGFVFIGECWSFCVLFSVWPRFSSRPHLSDWKNKKTNKTDELTNIRYRVFFGSKIPLEKK